MPDVNDWLGAGLALLLPGLLLWPWRTWLAPGSRGLTALLWLAPVGWGILGCGLFLLALLGCPPGRVSGLAILLSLGVLGWYLSRRRVLVSMAASPCSAISRWDRVGMGLALAAWGAIATAWASVGLKGSQHVPCVSVWGYKVQAILGERGLPFGLWEPGRTAALHPEYTLTWPMFLSWGQSWQGGDYDAIAIKLFPLLLGLWIAAQLYLFAREAGLGIPRSLMLSAAMAGGAVAQTLGVALYAENFQLVVLLSAFRVLGQARRAGLASLWTAGGVLLGLAAAVKQEGLLLVLLLGAGLVWREKEGRQALLRGLVPTLLLGLGAQMGLVKLLGMGSIDFAMTGGPGWPGVWRAVRETCSLLTCHGADYRWSGTPLALASFVGLALWSWYRGNKQAVMAACLPIMVLLLIFHGCFFFTQRDLGWHVQALDRLWHFVLIVSSGLLLVEISSHKATKSPIRS